MIFLVPLPFLNKIAKKLKHLFDGARPADTIRRLKNFEKSIKLFSEYLDEMSKLDPVKISEKIWKNGEIDYTTKLGLF